MPRKTVLWPGSDVGPALQATSIGSAIPAMTDLEPMCVLASLVDSGYENTPPNGQKMPSIRRHVYIAAAQRAVWRALTTSEGLTSWLVDEARVDPRNGGRVVWGYENDEGEPVEDIGTILKWRPTSHLEIKWDRTNKGPAAGSRLSFQLARDGDETRLSLIHGGSEAFEDEEQRAALDKEWRQALASLQGNLDAP